MHPLSLDSLAAYWSLEEVSTNIIVFFNLLGALLLGLLVGYERTFHGRAAGMRTYGLVCMASAALTVISGYPGFWFGGHASITPSADATRVIQGIVTGVGFLGAGVIMKEGFTISGLTTAASIWAASAIGVLVGVGFYAASMLLTLLSVLCMMWVSKLEGWLPSHQAIAVMLRFQPDFIPQRDTLVSVMGELGYDMAWGSISILYQNEKPEWHFVAVAQGKDKGAHLTDISQVLASFEGLESYTLSYARN